MLREKVAGSAKDGEIRIAERLKIGWAPDREPDIHNRRQLYPIITAVCILLQIASPGEKEPLIRFEEASRPRK